MTQDYFAILGIKDPKRIASLVSDLIEGDYLGLQRKFHDLSQKIHPDALMNNSEAGGTRETRTEQGNMAFQEINEAYKTLKNPTSLITYLIEAYILAKKHNLFEPSKTAQIFERGKRK